MYNKISNNKGDFLLKKLIVNADDLALTDGCTVGIIKCFNEGIVTSTTILVTADGWQKSALIAKDAGIGLGLHICLTYGKPLTQLDNMLDDNGFFKKIDKIQLPIDKKAIENEWRAQIKALFDMGIKPDHLDSHHHVHTLNQDLLNIAIKLAKKLNIPLRQTNDNIKKYCRQQKVNTTDVFVQDFYGQTASKENLLKILQTNWQGTMEIMCHPAIVDDRLLKISSYNTYRQKEFDILTDKDIRSFIEKEQIQLISFANI